MQNTQNTQNNAPKSTQNVAGGENKNLWIGIVVILIIVAAVAFFSMRKATAPVVSDDTTLVIPTEDTTKAPVGTGTSAGTLSYEKALAKYKDTRIQLERTCQATPDKVTFKNGTYMMIDNRAPVTRTVKMGSVFTMKPYSYKIVKLESATLPATWYIDCDKSQNVATILIQR